MTELTRKRREFRNINVFTDLPGYRMPVTALVSILHRISGALMIALLPFIVWMFDTSVSSEISFLRFTSAFQHGLFGVPGVMIKLAVLALIWAYLHHLIAGMRHVYMDIHHDAGKRFSRTSATVTLALSLILTLGLGAKLFGLY